MRIAVTGASGFVGGPLVAALARRGHQVRAGSRRAVTVPDGVDPVVHGDLAEPVDWAPLVRGMDAIVHLAGVAHTEGLADDRYDQINHRQTAVLAAAAGLAGVKRFVFVSSVRAQTGATARHPLTEADEARPTDPYGRSKLAAEQAIRASGVPFTILRPVLIYGPGVKGNLAALERLARARVPLPLGSLATRRSLCGLDGLIDAVDVVLHHDGAADQVFLVADREPIELRDLVAALRRGMGRGPGLFPLPPAVIKASLYAIRRRSIWERLGGELVVDPARLVALGWRAPDTAAGLQAMQGRG